VPPPPTTTPPPGPAVRFAGERTVAVLRDARVLRCSLSWEVTLAPGQNNYQIMISETNQMKLYNQARQEEDRTRLLYEVKAEQK
jgi:hypothetical protein